MANTYDGQTVKLDTAGAGNYVTTNGPAAAGHGDLVIKAATFQNTTAAAIDFVLFGTKIDGTGARQIDAVTVPADNTITKEYGCLPIGGVYATGVVAGAPITLHLE